MGSKLPLFEQNKPIITTHGYGGLPAAYVLAIVPPVVYCLQLQEHTHVRDRSEYISDNNLDQLVGQVIYMAPTAAASGGATKKL